MLHLERFKLLLLAVRNNYFKNGFVILLLMRSLDISPIAFHSRPRVEHTLDQKITVM